jgi:UDP-3-O-[3-hydroxymyristoyl] glucosamine N-acyltransferase
LTFAISGKFLAQAQSSMAQAVIIPPALENKAAPGNFLIFSDPRLFFAAFLALAEKALRPSFPHSPEMAYFKDRSSLTLGPGVTIGPGAYLGAGVKIGANSLIGPGAFLEDGVEIGQDCLIHPRAVLRYGTKVGDRCQIHAGAVIGEDGFGYNQVPFPEKGRLVHFKNPHLGGVSLGDDVEVGALAAIDRGLVSDTVIKTGAKIDNLVQIGHNSQIGRDCILVSQAGVAGHSEVGDRVFLLGQCGLNPGSKVGDDAMVGGQSGVLGTIPPGRRPWFGTPARPHQEELQSQALVRRLLPRLRRFLQLFKKSRDFGELKSLFEKEDGDR